MRFRQISYIIAAEYLKWPVIRTFAVNTQCVPVKRDGSDAAALKQCMRRLQDGQAMGIFIEGGINRPGRERQPKDGIAILALKTGAQVIPAYIDGIKYRESIIAGLFARHRARIRFGPPVDLDAFRAQPRDRQVIRAATWKIYKAIYDLAPPDAPRPAILSEEPLVEANS